MTVADLEESHWWFVARCHILRELVHALVPMDAGKVVVDFGCGTGDNLACVTNEYRAIGIDISEENIAQARSRDPYVQYIVGSAGDVVGNLSVDVTLSVDGHLGARAR